MKIVDINTLKGSDRHGSCVECENDFAEDKGMKRIIFGTDQKHTIFLCDKCYHDFLQEMNRRSQNMGKKIEKIESVAKMLNGRHMPKPYEVYKHFKGNLYVVFNVARHTETNELLVVYAATKEMQRIYARPLEMFMSEVDHEKYPDAKQTYRFENMMEG
jgi:hypothetical protein